MKILIVEDNTSISENIKLYLQAKWYFADVESNWEVAFDRIKNGKYDFLIIDRMIPWIDGLSLVRLLQFQKIEIPFLFLTALWKQVDKIEWLSLGADDYLVKPFDLEELKLRIDNIVRRWNNKITSSPSVIQLSDVTVDVNSKLVSKNSIIIDLSPKEYAILDLLIQNRGNILTRELIYESIWQDDYDNFSNVLDTVNVHIAHIRKKIWNNSIRTVKLSGYIIDLE